jgi:hypothetical protein
LRRTASAQYQLSGSMRLSCRSSRTTNPSCREIRLPSSLRYREATCSVAGLIDYRGRGFRDVMAISIQPDDGEGLAKHKGVIARLPREVCALSFETEVVARRPDRGAEINRRRSRRQRASEGPNGYSTRGRSAAMGLPLSDDQHPRKKVCHQARAAFAAAQTRIVSVTGIRWITGNLCDLSKG